MAIFDPPLCPICGRILQKREEKDSVIYRCPNHFDAGHSKVERIVTYNMDDRYVKLENGDIMCNDCGVLLGDVEKHDRYHKTLENTADNAQYASMLRPIK